MSEGRILVDSNAYFRLAQSIYPLLNVEFGDRRYCLYCLKELQDEYNKSSRLKNAFSWVNDPEYVKNRSHLLKITREENLKSEEPMNSFSTMCATFILVYQRLMFFVLLMRSNSAFQL